ncbi:hypothetical protein [Actinomadura madurae]|uniref:hypothetical protein n=1 Tax=Actinomadura madurae TaxID=1993 RepID=UPI0026E55E59|nr:hypothetical protein [Actinomadura madurae]
MRLLVVEDDPGMAALLVRGLRREGYAVDAVAAGRTRCGASGRTTTTASSSTP